jgi:hypothetical protein
MACVHVAIFACHAGLATSVSLLGLANRS